MAPKPFTSEIHVAEVCLLYRSWEPFLISAFFNTDRLTSTSQIRRFTLSSCSGYYLTTNLVLLCHRCAKIFSYV